MNDTNRKIDIHFRRERLKSVGFWVAMTALTVAFFLVLSIPPMGNKSEVHGTVISMIGVSTDEGEQLYLLVKLDSGSEVRSYIPLSAFYRKGKKVKLLKQEPIFFGRTGYRFRGYE